MDGPSRRWKLRWWAKRSRPPKIRFKDTVPSRRERRELRRRLRKAGRDELAEQKEQVTRGLRRLAARRVLVASMQSGPTRGNELIEFVQVADGTHLMLEVRGDGTAALRRLAARSASDTAYLDHVDRTRAERRLWRWQSPSGDAPQGRQWVVPTKAPSSGWDAGRRRLSSYDQPATGPAGVLGYEPLDHQAPEPFGQDRGAAGRPHRDRSRRPRRTDSGRARSRPGGLARFGSDESPGGPSPPPAASGRSCAITLPLGHPRRSVAGIAA
jgi:hypothetical protein